MGYGREQHGILCGQQPHGGSQTYMNTDNTDGGGKDVREGETEK